MLCIFCRKTISGKPSNEHVFPASIGGGLVINSICKSCNQTLGKKVDGPFAQDTSILFFRHLHTLSSKTFSGSKRKTPNPLKGIIHEEDGIRYRFVARNQEIVPIMLPKVSDIKEHEDGYRISISVSAEEKDRAFELMRRELKKLKLPENIPFKIESEIRNPVRLKEISVSGNREIIYLEGIKIAYEITAMLFPRFLDYKSSAHIAKMLLAGKLVRSRKYLTIFPVISETETAEIEKTFSKFSPLSHAAIVTSFNGRGLFVFVKIFTFYIWVEFESGKDFLPAASHTVINLFKENTWAIFGPFKPQKVQFNAKLKRVGRAIRRKNNTIFEEHQKFTDLTKIKLIHASNRAKLIPIQEFYPNLIAGDDSTIFGTFPVEISIALRTQPQPLKFYIPRVKNFDDLPIISEMTWNLILNDDLIRPNFSGKE